ncbi:MAG TPA: MATE family efflux transporter, partial [Bacteroidales bacterium]|nr:MATE family efflux transporter [Bacteroidales bacterium]
MTRVIKVFRLTIMAGTIVTCTGFLLVELFPHFISSAFTNDARLIQLSATGLRICFAVFPIVGFQIVTSSFFQSISKAKISIFLSLTRQVLFLIPMLLILPYFWQLNGVWMAIPAADFTSSLLTFIVMRQQLKKLKEIAVVK